MHLEYKVSLPDHDWVVAVSHKLIPSVYAGIVVNPDGQGDPRAVTYSGPTFIAVRSAKHGSSNAETHAEDLRYLADLPSFQPLIKTDEGAIKPVIIITVDGGPDENPRYPRVINCAIEHFKAMNLDAIFVATNAPGRSAYNRVERRMAPLSKALAGIILPHDHFGSHLDGQGKTVDKERELQNFQHAGKVLAQIWSEMVIDGHTVTAEFKSTNGERPMTSRESVGEEWYSRHVKESQYLLQIVKCGSAECCGTQRSSLRNHLPSGFLQPPHGIRQGTQGLTVTSGTGEGENFAPFLMRLAISLSPATKQFKEVPYDLNCPSVKSQLVARICKDCGLYHASQKSALEHNSIHKPKLVLQIPKIRPNRVAAKRAREMLACFYDRNTGVEHTDWVCADDVDYSAIGDSIAVDLDVEENQDLPVIESMEEWLASPWIEDTE